MSHSLDKIFDKAQDIKSRVEEIEELLYAPEISVDVKLYNRLIAEKNGYINIVKTYDSLLVLDKERQEVSSELSSCCDEELTVFLEEHLLDLENEYQSKVLILKDLFVEKKEESCVRLELFAKKQSVEFMEILKNIYIFYAEKNNLSYIKENNNRITIKGNNCYNSLINESGVHRFVTNNTIYEVNVLVIKNVDVENFSINDKDIRIDYYHSSGAGGQNVNKVETAIRITHKPTNIVVSCQDERSQLKNKNRAMDILREKLDNYTSVLSDKKYLESKKVAEKLAKTNNLVRVYEIDGKVTDIFTKLELPYKEVLTGELGVFINERLLQGE